MYIQIYKIRPASVFHTVYVKDKHSLTFCVQAKALTEGPGRPAKPLSPRCPGKPTIPREPAKPWGPEGPSVPYRVKTEMTES